MDDYLLKIVFVGSIGGLVLSECIIRLNNIIKCVRNKYKHKYIQTDNRLIDHVNIIWNFHDMIFGNTGHEVFRYRYDKEDNAIRIQRQMNNHISYYIQQCDTCLTKRSVKVVHQALLVNNTWDIMARIWYSTNLATRCRLYLSTFERMLAEYGNIDDVRRFLAIPASISYNDLYTAVIHLDQKSGDFEIINEHRMDSSRKEMSWHKITITKDNECIICYNLPKHLCEVELFDSYDRLLNDVFDT